MSSICFTRRRTQGFASLGVICLSFLSLWACDQKDAEAKEAPAAASPSEAADDARGETQQAAQAAEQAYDEQSFALELHGPSSAKVGQTIDLTILLAAKNGFKVNQDYPAKFKFDTSPGVQPKKEVVRKEDGKLEKTECEIPAQVVLTEAGKRRVTGRMSFSVCTDDRCLIEKRDLVIEIDAS